MVVTKTSSTYASALFEVGSKADPSIPVVLYLQSCATTNSQRSQAARSRRSRVPAIFSYVGAHCTHYRGPDLIRRRAPAFGIHWSAPADASSSRPQSAAQIRQAMSDRAALTNSSSRWGERVIRLSSVLGRKALRVVFGAVVPNRLQSVLCRTDSAGFRLGVTMRDTLDLLSNARYKMQYGAITKRAIVGNR